MSIDKDLLDRLMEGRSPGDLFGKSGILAELTKALADRNQAIGTACKTRSNIGPRKRLRFAVVAE